MLKYILSMGMVLAPSMSLALSCVAPDPVQSLQFAANPERPQEIMLGEARVSIPPQMPLETHSEIWRKAASERMNQQVGVNGDETDLGRFGVTLDVTGLAMTTLEGEILPWDKDGAAPVVVSQTCMGPWCSGLPPVFFDEDETFWVVMTDAGEGVYEIRTSACAGSVFQFPDENQKDDALSRLKDVLKQD
jgi:hypothetical protein